MTLARVRSAAVVLVAAMVLRAGLAGAAESHLPQAVGECVTTRIVAIGTRFGDPLSAQKPALSQGTLVTFANEGVQVSYDWVSAVARSRVGDDVRLCLTFFPEGCPPGDTRGKVYKTTNLRTGESWSLSDSQHMCGGA